MVGSGNIFKERLARLIARPDMKQERKSSRGVPKFWSEPREERAVINQDGETRSASLVVVGGPLRRAVLNRLGLRRLLDSQVQG